MPPWNILYYWLSLWLILSAGLIGSVHYDTQIIISFGGLLSFVLASYLHLRHSRRKHKHLYITGLMLLLFFMSTWMLLQLIPLPASLLKYTSPYLYEILSRRGDMGSWHSISYEKVHTFFEAVKYFAYAGYAFAVYIYCRKVSTGGRNLIRLIVFMGAAFAVAALVHIVLGIKTMWGVYAPRDTNHFIIPFVNMNHASGFYSLIFFLTLGLALDEAEMRMKIFYFMLAPLSLAITVISQSRGGILSLAVGSGVFFWFYRRHISKQGGGLYAVFTVILFAMIPVLDRFVIPFIESSTPLRDAKFMLLNDALSLARNHLLAGIGKGSFISVFPHYQQTVASLDIHFAENLILQMLIDFGIVFTGIFLISAAFMIIRTVSFIRYRIWRIGIMAACSALIFQNMFDFNLEFAGTGLSFIVCLGILSSLRFTGKVRSWRLDLPLRPALAGVLILTIAFSSLLVVNRGKDIHSQRTKLVELYKAKNTSLTARSREYSKIHPADFYITAVRGYAETLVEKGKPLKWIGIASWLSPRHHLPEIMAARLLFNWGNKKQARIQYKRAVLKGKRIDSAFINELRLRWPDVRKWTSIFPTEEYLGKVYFQLSESERVDLCSEMRLKGISHENCFKLLIYHLFQKENWKELSDVSLAWIAQPTYDSPLAWYFALRSDCELKRQQEFELHLEKAIRVYKTDAPLIMTWILYRHFRDPKFKARDWIKERLRSPTLTGVYKYYLYSALYMITEDKVEKITYQTEMRTRRKLIRSAAAENILGPLWTKWTTPEKK